MTYMGVIGQLTLVPKGEKFDVEWKMNFASISNQVYAYYCSRDFSFESESWYLVIWPNGNKNRDSTGYIDLLLFKRFSSSHPINVKVSLALKTVNGQKDLERRCTNIFQSQYSKHYIHRLISKSNFEERQSEFLSSGLLTVVCILKRLNSTRSATAINTTESIVVYNHNKIQQDFKQAFLKRENCDVILNVKGREFQVHKFILAARSPVFASTFRNDMKEKETGVLDIEDCDPSIFSDFLCFLYCDDVESLSEKNVFGLFFAADKYNIPNLRQKCLETMNENLSVETFCETLTLAIRHSETELIHSTTYFLIKNAEKILVTLKWQSFIAENPTQSNELVIKLVASCTCSKSGSIVFS